MEAVTKKENNELDLVFLCDCTGSMGSYIQVAKDNINEIIGKLQASEKRDIRFAVIGYRDHPPQEQSWVTKVYPFTKSVKTARAYVQELSAEGGGDTPEAVGSAIYEASQLPYRKEATKIVVIVADAPPHGLGKHTSGDGFPNGEPNGHDPIALTHKMAETAIIIYSVGCQPALGQSTFAVEFFKALAIITGGRYIDLGNAKILPGIIIGGAEEEIALEKLSAEMAEEQKKIEAEAIEKKKTYTEDEMDEEVYSRLQAKGVQAPTLKVTALSPQETLESPVAQEISKCTDLEAVRKLLDAKMPAPSTSSYAPSSYSSRSSRFDDDACEEQCESEPAEYMSTTDDFSGFTFAPAPSYAKMEEQTCTSEVSSVSYDQIKRKRARDRKRK